MHDRKEIGIFNKLISSTAEEMDIIGQNGLRGKKKRRKIGGQAVF